MANLLVQATGILRGEFSFAPFEPPRKVITRLIAFIMVCGFGYGAVMGTFGGLGGERVWQVIYSAAKVPLLLFATFLVSLPSFFVFNTLFGLRSDFPQVIGVLFATQAGLTVLLLALAPYTALWYVSSSNYDAAVIFNGVMFGMASLGAQWLLSRSYQPLITANPKHRVMLRVWLGIYIFVGIQMGWILRPFVGDPSLPVQFFRREVWGNAYVEVVKKIWNALAQ